MQDRSESSIVLKYIDQIPVNLEAMAAELGLQVVYYDHLPSGIAGKLERDVASQAGFRIIVNAKDNPMRQRFTLAHEIAHFVLHRDLLPNGLIDTAFYRSSLSDEYERQADRFASSIILPAEALKSAYKQDKSIAGLASKFRVSSQAMHIRLKELQLGP